MYAYRVRMCTCEQCDMAEGVWKLIEAVITSKPSQEQIPVSFLGGGCSVSTVPLAALTGPFYNATQVCSSEQGINV